MQPTTNVGLVARNYDCWLTPSPANQERLSQSGFSVSSSTEKTASAGACFSHFYASFPVEVISTDTLQTSVFWPKNVGLAVAITVNGPEPKLPSTYRLYNGS